MKFDLSEKLRCLLDQPVRIFTDDERMITGMVVGVNGDFVRIHEDCGDIFLVAICHIASIEEPHMKLLRRCCKRTCRCREREECEDEFECEDDEFGGCPGDCCERRRKRERY